MRAMFTEDGRQERYHARIFDVRSIEDAKRVILGDAGEASPDSATDVEDRWRKETAFLVAQICDNVTLSHGSVVVDYGCGIGRIASELILRTGCDVIGADISPSMRALSHVYVSDPRFITCDPTMLTHLKGIADLVVAVWALQHAEDPFAAVTDIKHSLKLGGHLFLVNNLRRAIPVDVDGEFWWRDDGLDVTQIIVNAGFRELRSGKLPVYVGTRSIAEGTFWAWYKREA